jgi:putative ABC transport system permease protein
VGTALRDPIAPTMYIPLTQADGLMPPGLTRITIGVRPIAGPPAGLATNVGASLTSIANVSYSFRPLADVVSAAFAPEQLVAMLSGVFGALALFLAGLGLYGVSSYAIAQRRREIGIRVALGAPPRSVAGLMLRRVAILVGLGLVEGVALSFWVREVVTSMLFGLSPNDPVTLIGAILTLSVVGVAAGFFPAMRAARVDPTIALRAE